MTVATALIVVDVQNDFADPTGGLVRAAAATTSCRSSTRRSTAARRGGALVVYTQDWHPESTPHFAKDGGIWPVHCVADTGEPSSTPTSSRGGRSVRKGTAARTATPASRCGTRRPARRSRRSSRRSSASRGVERVVVGGLATDYCVKATALDAVRLGLPDDGAGEAIAPSISGRATGAGHRPDRGGRREGGLRLGLAPSSRWPSATRRRWSRPRHEPGASTVMKLAWASGKLGPGPPKSHPPQGGQNANRDARDTHG